MNNELIPLGVTAQFLGVTEKTLHRWHEMRTGPARIMVGRRIFYRQSAIEKWFLANETRPTRTFSGDRYGDA